LKHLKLISGHLPFDIDYGHNANHERCLEISVSSKSCNEIHQQIAVIRGMERGKEGFIKLKLKLIGMSPRAIT